MDLLDTLFGHGSDLNVLQMSLRMACAVLPTLGMIRQAGLAIGVAVLVAIIGRPDSIDEQIHAFRLAWWVMATIVLLALVPTWTMIRVRKTR